MVIINIKTNVAKNIINLVDDYNESLFYSVGSSPIDNVTGYNLAFIESNMLKRCYGLSSLSTQLKNNRPAGVTDADIDLLLGAY